MAGRKQKQQQSKQARDIRKLERSLLYLARMQQQFSYSKNAYTGREL